LRGIRPARELVCEVAFSFLAFIVLFPIQLISVRLERNRSLSGLLMVLHAAFFLSALVPFAPLTGRNVKSLCSEDIARPAMGEKGWG